MSLKSPTSFLFSLRGNVDKQDSVQALGREEQLLSFKAETAMSTPEETAAPPDYIPLLCFKAGMAMSALQETAALPNYIQLHCLESHCLTAQSPVQILNTNPADVSQGTFYGGFWESICVSGRVKYSWCCYVTIVFLWPRIFTWRCGSQLEEQNGNKHSSES